MEDNEKRRIYVDDILVARHETNERCMIMLKIGEEILPTSQNTTITTGIDKTAAYVNDFDLKAFYIKDMTISFSSDVSMFTAIELDKARRDLCLKAVNETQKALEAGNRPNNQSSYIIPKIFSFKAVIGE